MCVSALRGSFDRVCKVSCIESRQLKNNPFYPFPTFILFHSVLLIKANEPMQSFREDKVRLPILGGMGKETGREGMEI